MRVLILEDNAELRSFFALSLAEEGIEAEAAQDAADALRRIEVEKFDVLIVDSVMADVDGIEVVQKIRASKNGRSVPIVLMSAIGTGLARRIAKNAGCTEFLVKPFGQAQLIEQVKNLA